MRGVETANGGRLGDVAGPGGHSANLEARRSFLRGSWRLCTPSLKLSMFIYLSMGATFKCCSLKQIFYHLTLKVKLLKIQSNSSNMCILV